MSNFDAEKAVAAAKAVEEVRDGMLVGLGTGSTAAYAVKSLSERIKRGLRITAVATSQSTETLARRLAVPLISFEQLSAVDLTIDGADEIDDRFHAKGWRRRPTSRESHRGRIHARDHHRRFQQAGRPARQIPAAGGSGPFCQ